MLGREALKWQPILIHPYPRFHLHVTVINRNPTWRARKRGGGHGRGGEGTEEGGEGTEEGGRARKRGGEGTEEGGEGTEEGGRVQVLYRHALPRGPDPSPFIFYF